jgi:1-acyl-sn-glycerol-3-phosphate acyltransferase
VRRLRAVLRLVAALGVSFAAYGVQVAAGRTLDLARRIAGRRQPAYAFRGRVLRAWARALIRVLGVRVTVSGTPPASPFFLVSNHLGYLDVVVLGSQVPCVFVARGDLAEWPVAGRLCRSAGTVFIDRENKRDIPRAIGRIADALADGAGVIVFPEGTSSAGAGVLPFRPSLLDVPARDGIPVSWAAVSYERTPGEPPPHLSVCWWGGMPFGPHARALLGLREIRATVAWGDAPVVESDRKILAARLHEAVARRFRPVVSGSGSLGAEEA